MAQGHSLEAALCYLHRSAYMIEFLKFELPNSTFQEGSKAFSKCNWSFQEEIVTDIVKGDLVFSKETFNGNEVLSGIEKSIPLFIKAHAYEVVNEIFKLLIPVWERRKEFKRLSQAYSTLSETFSSLENRKDRVLASYYRVAFLGPLWKELEGKQYVYREINSCSLPEFVSRMKVRALVLQL
jgi:hypothetical protein